MPVLSAPCLQENQWSAFTADGESAGGYGMLLLNNSLVCESVISVNDMVEGREAVVYAAAVAKARAVPSPASTLALAVIVPASVMGECVIWVVCPLSGCFSACFRSPLTGYQQAGLCH